MDQTTTTPLSCSSQPNRIYHWHSDSTYIGLSTGSAQPIYLTPFYPSDASAIKETLSIPEVYLHLVAVPQPYTIADAEWWINLQLSGRGNFPLQVLRYGDPESGRFIGSVSLMPDDSETVIRLQERLPNLCPKEDEFQLGYYLHPDFRGKGIMRLAVKALLSWGVTRGVKTVVVKVLEGNMNSRKVIEGVPAFVRQEKDDEWVDWPVEKGGGRRKILAWRFDLEEVTSGT